MYRNREYGSQLKDFSGLRWGAISPTDIDAILEFSNRLFIIVEAKYKNAQVPFGQKLCLERLCDAINDPPNKHCLILLTSHESDGDIDMGLTVVTQVRENGSWITEIPDVTLREAIDIYRGKYLGQKVT
jgi:hypothetical protein